MTPRLRSRLLPIAILLASWLYIAETAHAQLRFRTLATQPVESKSLTSTRLGTTAVKTAAAAPVREIAPVQADPRVLRARVADASAVQVGHGELTLEVFPDAVARFRFHDLVDGETTRTWVGHVDDQPDDHVALTFGEGLAYGRAHLDGAHYELVGVGDAMWIVREVEALEDRPCAGGVDPDLAPVASRAAATELARQPVALRKQTGDVLHNFDGPITTYGEAGDYDFQLGVYDKVFKTLGSTIDVLGIFTPALRQNTFDWLYYYTPFIENAAGMNAIDLGREVMRLTIQHAVDQTNVAFAASGVTHRLRLVHTEEVQLVEDAQVIDDYLEWVKAEMNSFASPVGQLRETHDADLVALWVADGVSACGQAYRLPNLTWSYDDWAASVTDAFCQYKYTFTHEIGHNFGAAHDYASGVDGDVVFPYAYGYTGPGFRTLMSYGTSCADPDTDCPRIPYFSSPHLTSGGGHPMGTASGEHNARTLEETGERLAGYR